MRTVFERLKDNGIPVSTLGLYENDGANIGEADVIIFPVPTTRDKKTVFCPLTNAIIPLDIVKKAKKDALILSGNYKFEGRNFIDYCSLDGYSVKNAVLTAEGALAFAIQNTDFSLWNSKILIIGYGRVGKALCDRLIGMRADLTVSARKSSDFAAISSLGVKYIHSNTVESKAENFDIVFNTVDAPLLENCKYSLKDTLVIDLSSDGCIDYSAPFTEEIKIIKLPALPGKTAPKTAGEILAQTVIELI